MAGHQRPGKTRRFHLFQDRTQMFGKIMTAWSPSKKSYTGQCPGNEVVQRSRRVYA